MGSTSVSLLEERLAARLWWRTTAHPQGYELDPSVQLLDLEDVPAAGGAACAEALPVVVDEDDDEQVVDLAGAAAPSLTAPAVQPLLQERASSAGQLTSDPTGAPLTASASVPPEEPVGAPALLPEACLVGVRDAVALEWAALTPGTALVAAVEELWAELAADLDAACRSTDAALAGAMPNPAAPDGPVGDGVHPAAGPDAEDASASTAPLDLDDEPDQLATLTESVDAGAHPCSADEPEGAGPSDESDGSDACDEPDHEDPTEQPEEGAGASAWGAVSDAELVEAVAACERQIAALAARRDQIAGVFASRRAAEADADVADARAATARDGKGRPWAIRPRSTAPSELCARLGIGSVAADALVERGLAAVGAQRDVAAAMAAGALPAAAGAWMLEQLSAVHTTAYVSALERESATREQALAEERAAQDAASVESGQAPLSREQVRARAAADQADVDAHAESAAAAHAERVAAAVRRELLARATGTSSWSVDDGGGAGQDQAPTAAPSTGTTADTADTGSGSSTGSGSGADAGPAGPAGGTSRPTAGAGLGPNRRAWTKRLNTAVHRADADAAQRRAAKARAGCSTARWSEADGQAAVQLRGPAEDIAVITAAMDARARRRQEAARAAERAAATAEGRPFDRSAVGSLDAHRIAAVKEWATAALEISETSGVSGTWYPVARTAASKPVVHLVLPWTVLAGVTTIGAQLAGYGPIGAVAALRIAADGLWRRVLADPACGAAVGIEEGAWRPSTALARLVGLRWWSSTMPSSTRPVGLDHGPAGGASGGGGAGGGQLDHVQPYAVSDLPGGGGPTEVTNLQLLAQSEHLLKQAGEHARPGHGWSVAVERTGPPGPFGPPGPRGQPGPGGQPPAPAPGDGVVWTAPTGHTYRVSPQVLLEPDEDRGRSTGAGCSCGGGAGTPDPGGLPVWVHRLLADVLPAWVGWPPDGAPASTRSADGNGERQEHDDAVAWSVDWARAVFTDVPPDPAPEHDNDDEGGEEPYLFDDLPAA